MSRNIIGKYQGKDVYKTTLSEYVNNRWYKDKYYVFLIDGELIFNNEAFASYDGNYVTNYDYGKKRTFYEIPKFDRAMENYREDNSGYDTADGNYEIETSSTTGYSTESVPPKSVDETLAGVYETDYFSGMTDVDAYLNSVLEN